MADTLTLYKLIVLKMLDEADAPLTGAQITDFIWEKESLWPAWLERLTGNKVLIRGNHDPREFNTAPTRFFQTLPITKRLLIPDGTSSYAIIQCPFTGRTMMRNASCCTATSTCLLYALDAADDNIVLILFGRLIFIKKKIRWLHASLT